MPAPKPSASPFAYFIAFQGALQGPLAVVSLVGELKRESGFTLQSCQKNLVDSNVKWVILNFRDVSPLIERASLPLLSTFLQNVRTKPIRILLCGLHPELKRYLETQGVTRAEESSPNLAAALQQLTVLENGSQAA